MVDGLKIKKHFFKRIPKNLSIISQRFEANSMDFSYQTVSDGMRNVYYRINSSKLPSQIDPLSVKIKVFK